MYIYYICRLVCRSTYSIDDMDDNECNENFCFEQGATEFGLEDDIYYNCLETVQADSDVEDDADDEDYLEEEDAGDDGILPYYNENGQFDTEEENHHVS